MHPADAAHLADIRQKLNYYRRAERAALKNIQKYCGHRDVYKKVFYPQSPVNSAAYAYVRYDIICKECGKRL